MTCPFFIFLIQIVAASSVGSEQVVGRHRGDFSLRELLVIQLDLW